MENNLIVEEGIKDEIKKITENKQWNKEMKEKKPK